VFKNETKSSALKGLAAAASLAVMAFASHASAAETFTLVSASMNTSYTATIAGFGDAYDNGVTFQVSGYNIPPTTSLFGFCIDIYHDMYLGALGYTFTSNQDTGGGLLPNSGTTLTNHGGANPLDPLNQISAISNLVDTGWILHQQSPNDAGTIMKLAAIQAAIWQIEVPLTNGHPTVTLDHPNATVAGDPHTIGDYFNNYVSGNYTSLADSNDRVFTIYDGAHQSFAIGWPIPNGVPEPATWAMMLTGFFGMGSMLRNRRKLATASI
jgi:hypothetical protein